MYTIVIKKYAPQVELVEGSWPNDRAIGALLFESSRDALMWLDSDTDIKQGDWLHGADVVIVPMLRCIGKSFDHIKTALHYNKTI